ncbi:MAG TPA: hypothetical protein VGG44_10955, partial [Tepidisphaeraceae bacterium]
TAVGRGGASILHNLNLPQFITQTPGEYISKATSLANDLPCLTELRTTLRKRMLGSPLTDSVQFARDIEAAFIDMWHRWANSPTT